MRRLSTRNTVLIAAALVLLSLGAYAVYEQTSSRRPAAEPTEFDPKRDSEGAIREDRRSQEAPSPAAGDDAAETNPNAPAAGIDPKAPQTQAPAKQSVKPFITGVDVRPASVEVGAMTGGISSGTCTAVFTRTGHSEVTKTSKIELIATTYGCTMSVDRKLLAPGEWSVRVSAEGSNAAGTSDPQTVMIP